jgi:hypothetical protein
MRREEGGVEREKDGESFLLVDTPIDEQSDKEDACRLTEERNVLGDLVEERSPYLLKKQQYLCLCGCSMEREKWRLIHSSCFRLVSFCNVFLDHSQ